MFFEHSGSSNLKRQHQNVEIQEVDFGANFAGRANSMFQNQIKFWKKLRPPARTTRQKLKR